MLWTWYLRIFSDRTQPLDATTDADDYIGRYARITASQNNYNVFDRDLPGKTDAELGFVGSTSCDMFAFTDSLSSESQALILQCEFNLTLFNWDLLHMEFENFRSLWPILNLACGKIIQCFQLVRNKRQKTKDVRRLRRKCTSVHWGNCRQVYRCKTRSTDNCEAFCW